MAGAEDSLFSKTLRPALGPTKPPYLMGTSSSFTGGVSTVELILTFTPPRAFRSCSDNLTCTLHNIGDVFPPI